MTRRIRSTVPILCLLLLVPATAAFTAEMEFPPTRLPPGGSREADLVVTATCEEVWERSPPLVESSLQVTLTHEAPEGFTINGPDSITLDTDPCTASPQDGTATGSATFTFAVDRSAPGLVAHEVAIEAELSGGELGEPVTNRTEGVVTTGFIGSMEYDVDQPILLVGLEEDGTYSITITNTGNAPTTASFSLSGSGPPGVDVTLPSDVTIGSAAHGQENEQTVTITAQAGSVLKGFEGALSIDVSVATWATEEPTLAGPEGQVKMQLRIQDSKGLPAPTPLFAVAVLIVALLTARRRA